MAALITFVVKYSNRKCRYFREKFDVLPEIIYALDLLAQNTFGYRRMLKNNFFYQSCKKHSEKTDNAYAILRNMEYIEIHILREKVLDKNGVHTSG